LQAGILRIKLKYLDEYAKTRQQVADYYDKAFQHCKQIVTPQRAAYSTHVFHQYTIQLKNVGRDELKTYLQKQDIPSMIYYPVPLHTQKAYQGFNFKSGQLSNTTLLCNNVLSLPIHTEITEEQLEYITEKVLTFINLKN
jgi:dTDP-4-amino-4,6-dideoxygalactose transaminase